MIKVLEVAARTLDHLGRHCVITEVLKSSESFLLWSEGGVTTEEWSEGCEAASLKMEQESHEPRNAGGP